MGNDFDNFLNDFERELNKGWNKTKIRVMVLGPNTDKNTLGAILRKFIISKCENNYTTIKGEHKRLIERYQKVVGPNGNLCTMEYDIAKNSSVDAIVIIPDSPGSLVELGLFALEQEICRKTLLLFKDKYQDSSQSSFISLGPQRAYSQKRASVQFVNYRKKKVIWETVRQFLLGFKAIKYDEMLIKGN